MDRNAYQMLIAFNRETKKLDDVYRSAAKSCGISECAFWILYTLRVEEKSFTQAEICEFLIEPKQTVNSALRGLEGKGILALQQYKGRAKKVVLTEAGREYAAQTAGRLFAAEVRALDAWPTEEINEYICLMEKYVAGLRAQIEQLL